MMRLTRRVSWLLLPLSFLPASAALAPAELERARFRLENQLNELELLLANQKSDRADLERQERERKLLKVRERIPFELDLAGLRRDLAATAKRRGLALVRFKALPRASRASRPPAAVHADGEPFRLLAEQVAEAVPFEVVVRARDAEAARAWADSWREQQMRLAEPKAPVAAAGKGLWRVRGQAFRYFGDVKFPRIEARDPAVALSPAARKDPRLAALVARIREVRPKAAPLYEARREFLLEDARMTFFLRKALPPELAGRASGD